MRIVLGAPVKNRAWCLKEHLEILTKAIEHSQKTKDIEFYSFFIENDSKDKTWEIIKDWEASAPVEGHSTKHHFDAMSETKCLQQEHLWEYEKTGRMAEMRTKILKKADTLDASVFTCDTDIFFAKSMINHLVDLNEEIVSPVLWSDWRDSMPINTDYPQVWGIGSDAIAQPILDRMRQKEPCLVRVHGFGAITWIDVPRIKKRVERDYGIRREQFFKIFNYYKIEESSFMNRGEDRAFATKAGILGCKPLASSRHVEVFHVDGKTEWEHHYKSKVSGLLAE